MKLYIVGIVASGKTTLARRLSAEQNIPWYELDCIVYPETPEGRRKRTPAEQVREIRKIDRQGSWMIEGTYRKSCGCLLELADIILFLDPPLWKRKIHILTRFVKQKTGLEKCHYKPSLHMLKMMYRWTNEFERNRSDFEHLMNRYSEKLIVLTENESSARIAESIRKNIEQRKCVN